MLKSTRANLEKIGTVSMHYDPAADDHGLPFNPFKSCVIPRPIGWISTTSPQGIDNLAPFSQFQNLTYDPPIVMFAANQSVEGRVFGRVVDLNPGTPGRWFLEKKHRT